ncbi:ArsR/SmtB family transcription factor [Planktotalea arctica]|uniref:ArsR/SmtB family transcription factor n=1 Tax=Planktotalea arctica TaxID=1481893 RepID=UPI00321BB542
MTNQLDQIFFALADPTRRAVVERLSQGAAPVSELHAPHDMALPTFLRHLKVLEDSGLTHSEKTGRVRTVSIKPDQLGTLENWLKEQRSTWEQRLDRLALLAAQLERTKT